MTDLRQTKEYAKYMESLGWSVIGFQVSDVRCQIFARTIPLVGKVAKLQRPEKIDFAELEKWVGENKVSTLFVEPSLQTGSVPSAFKSASSAFLPSKTIHIDFTKSEKQLLKEMHPKTRYNIKVAQKRGVAIQESSDINTFIALWSKSALARGMWLPQKKEIEALYKAFGKKAHILLATKEGETIAGVLMVRTPNTGYYMYAGSLSLGKNLFAPTLLAWEAIKLTKGKGCKVFDFEGIYDERYHSQTKAWRGFTRFKEGFGGKVVSYPPTLVKYSNLLCRFLI